MLDESEEPVAERITVSITALEIARMDKLVRAPELRFKDRQHFVWAALISFLNYKEKELHTIRTGGQVSESAIIALSGALEMEAERLAEESGRILRARNDARSVQRLEPLRRLTDEHVREALRRLNGNP